VIGVFDSGLGGLSVLREIVRLMPEESFIYLADQAHVPYGSRSLLEVRQLTLRAAGWLIEQGCNPIVVACNTASAAALRALRDLHPGRRFVGMEPAVKPAAAQTRTGTIGVLATPATFQGELFASVVTRFAAQVRVIEQTCPGWVEMVETGLTPANPRLSDLDRQAGRRRVARYVEPLLEAGVDALVLGCTHFPFLSAWIEDTAAAWKEQRGEAAIRLIDPSPAVARQTLRVRDIIAGEVQQSAGRACNIASRHAGERRREFWTTGAPDRFNAIMWMLLPDWQGETSRRLALTEREPKTATLIASRG
jgi:glutamate racemase